MSLLLIPGRRSRRSPALPLLIVFAMLLSSLALADRGSNDSSRPQTLTAAPLGGTQDDLLKWALAHSDPDALRRAAREARDGAEAGSPEFAERQRRVQQLVQATKANPSEAELMQEAVSMLSSGSAPPQQLSDALDALRVLVEPIDAANDLQGMGGLAPVVALLAAGQPPAVQARAAQVLGTAASNNLVFQSQLLGDHPEALSLLLALLQAGGAPGAAAEAAEAASKALHCLASLLRGSAAARDAFYRASGAQALQALLRGGGDARMLRQALGLVADLIQLGGHEQAGRRQQQPDAGMDRSAALAAAMALLDVDAPAVGAQQDGDVLEKAMLVVAALLDSTDAAATASQLAERGGTALLARLQASLKNSAGSGGDSDYVLELAALAARVQARAEAVRSGAADGSAGREASEL